MNRLSILIVLALFTVVCAAEDESARGDGDGDIDGDADGDTDGDADSDGDADGDADGDGDVGEDPLDGAYAQQATVGVCLDGELEDRSGLQDCEDLSCVESTGCCQAISREWISDGFSGCSDLEECGWFRFPSNEGTHVLDGGWVTLNSAGNGEVGLYSDPVVDLRGRTIIEWVMALEPVGCVDGACQQAMGVALTFQDELSSGTGVDPAVGVVLDGEQELIHLLINGRIEESFESEHFEDLTTPRGYALEIQPQGGVALWLGNEVVFDGDEPRIERSEEPSYESLGVVFGDGERLRLAVFGHFEGSGSGRVGGIELQRPICDVPDGFEPLAERPEVAPEDEGLRVGRPSVIRGPITGYPFYMYYETDDGLAVATSADGSHWDVEGAIQFSHEYSPNQQIHRRAPAAVYIGPDSELRGFHLWYEAEGEAQIDGEGQALPRSMIMHAYSTDGLTWTEEGDEAVAIRGEQSGPWMGLVLQPTVTALEDETLLMFFVGIDELTGERSLGRATSLDGKNWMVSEEPMEIELGEQAFARDGVGYPTLVRRGETFHLWYTGYNGARASIGYAVGRRDNAQEWTWELFGPVLEARARWEGRRVAAPTVVSTPPLDGLFATQVGVIHLWYQAGSIGRERIGHVVREIPVRVDISDDGTQGSFQ